MATVRSRTAQVARSALAVPGVLIAVVGAGLLGSPAIAQAAVGDARRDRPARGGGPARRDGAARGGGPARRDRAAGHSGGRQHRRR